MSKHYRQKCINYSIVHPTTLGAACVCFHTQQSRRMGHTEGEWVCTPTISHSYALPIYRTITLFCGTDDALSLFTVCVRAQIRHPAVFHTNLIYFIYFCGLRFVPILHSPCTKNKYTLYTQLSALFGRTPKWRESESEWVSEWVEERIDATTIPK